MLSVIYAVKVCASVHRYEVAKCVRSFKEAGQRLAQLPTNLCPSCSQHQHHQQHQQDQKTKVLPVANNTTEVRHEYLAKIDYFSLFPLLPEQFSAHDAAIGNKRKTTEKLKLKPVSEYLSYVVKIIQTQNLCRNRH